MCGALRAGIVLEIGARAQFFWCVTVGNYFIVHVGIIYHLEYM